MTSSDGNLHESRFSVTVRRNALPTISVRFYGLVFVPFTYIGKNIMYTRAFPNIRPARHVGACICEQPNTCGSYTLFSAFDRGAEIEITSDGKVVIPLNSHILLSLLSLLLCSDSHIITSCAGTLGHPYPSPFRLALSCPHVSVPYLYALIHVYTYIFVHCTRGECMCVRVSP